MLGTISRKTGGCGSDNKIAVALEDVCPNEKKNSKILSQLM